MGFIKECICCIQGLYYLSVCSGILSIAILILVNYEDRFDQYKIIVDSWRLEPILELSASSSEQCQENEITFSEYIWPGTKDGCDCTHIAANDRFPQIIYPFICNSTHLTYKCEIVKSHNQVKFQSFPTQSGSSFILCGKRSQGHSFYLTENICKEGEHLCGEMTDNQYCSINGDCPIYSVEITTSQQLNQSNEYLQLSKEEYLIIRRTSYAYFPLNQFKVSEMKGPCHDANQLSITPGRIEYVLMNKQKQTCELDLNYRLIQVTNEVDYYQVNNFSYITNVLPGYVLDSQYYWGIFQRGYIEWKLQCRGDILQKFKGYEIFLSSIDEEQSIIFYICLLYTIFVCGLTVSSCLSDNFDCCCCRKKIRGRLFVIFNFSLKISASITLFYFILPTHSTLNIVIPVIQTIINQKCSDQHTISGLTNYLFHLQFYLHYYYKIFIYILISTFIFEFFILTIYCLKYTRNYCKLRNDRQDKNEIQNAVRIIPIPIIVQAQKQNKEEFDYHEASIPEEDNQDNKIYHFKVEKNNNELFENKAE